MIKNLLLTVCLSVFLTGSIFAQPAEAEEIIFPALGNCYLCKVRIEAKLNLTEGVLSSNWDYNTKITTVEYDETVTDPFEIMQAVADTGHDTEWYPAPDDMYALLIGSCCEYERTIDYTNVQIGYLSLMGIWVFPVGVAETEDPYHLSIYPSVGAGIVTLDFGNRLPLQEPILSLYSMSGGLVYQSKLALQSRSRLDLTSIANGQYLAVVTINNEILNKSKLIISQ